MHDYGTMNLSKDLCRETIYQYKKSTVVVQLLSHVRLFVIPWTAASQASLFFTIFWSLLKLTCIESVMPSNHLVFCHPLLLLPSIFPSIRVFSNESAFCIRWPNTGASTSASAFTINIPGLISFRINWLNLLAGQGTQESSTPQFENVNSSAFSLLYGPTFMTIHDQWKNHTHTHTYEAQLYL